MTALAVLAMLPLLLLSGCDSPADMRCIDGVVYRRASANPNVWIESEAYRYVKCKEHL